MAHNNYQINSLEEYNKAYQQSIDHPEMFWSEIADTFLWHKKWNQVLSWNFKEPKVAWFTGGELNVSENCLDRHLEERGNEPAIIWEPNDPNEYYRVLTYKELHHKVMQMANVLIKQGVQKGDVVCIYMGMIPELTIAMLACARIGAIHSVIFGGFSAQAIADRLEDAKAKIIITCDGSNRGNKVIPLKPIVDEALNNARQVEKVIVCTHTRNPISMIKGRDVWWEDEIKLVESKGNPEVKPASMNAEDELFILYTSGSTGKPKGVVHTSAGYLIWANYTFLNVFQYHPNDLFFCTADVGWITGHSYLVYGPLSAGATVLMFEGVPTYPDAGRFWDIIEKHKVNIFYTAPTAIRSLMNFEDHFFQRRDLSSLKVLGSVGEPINEEAWNWFNQNIGNGKLPIVDTWWQTETGGIMISNLAGITPQIPTYATLPLPGVHLVIVDEKGNKLEGNDVSGFLCIDYPWPGMIRTTFGDHERCRTTYFTVYENMYFTGDGCYRDKDGNYKITGRVDDVLNVSGHRIGTAELENAINMHLDVIESAVVGYPHPVKGQGIYAFVVYKGEEHDLDYAKSNIIATINKIIGPIAKPDKIQFVKELPKTRSGKIMRRILRKLADGTSDSIGDTSTLLDPGVIDTIKKELIP